MPSSHSSDLTRFSFNMAYIIESLRSGFSVIDDENFDKYIYTEKIQKLSNIHWTPVSIAMQASELLVRSENDRILDIGSGVGKFCIIAALYTKAKFYGVEQREGLYLISEKAKRELELTNVTFIHSNIDQIVFSDYNAFYFFNPFIENVFPVNRIDDSVDLLFSKYNQYTEYVRAEFRKLPVNTRIVTYCCGDEIIPYGYFHEYNDAKSRLSLWVKKNDIL